MGSYDQTRWLASAFETSISMEGAKSRESWKSQILTSKGWPEDENFELCGANR